MLTAEDIVRFDDADPPVGKTPWVGEEPLFEPIEIVPSNPGWPDSFQQLSALIRDALGDLALEIEHVGSTSVPSLPAKPIIDIDLIVPNSEDEVSWLPALESAGFVLKIREPWWYQHRCLTFSDPRCNLHVFSTECAESERHKIFRDWLRSNSNDLDLYRETKLAAADEANVRSELVQDYNARKQRVIREIYARAFAAKGYL